MHRSEPPPTRVPWPALILPLLLATSCTPAPTAPQELGGPDVPPIPSGRFALSTVNGAGLPFGRAQPSGCGLSVQITGGHLTLDQASGEFSAAVTTRFPCRTGSVLQEDQARGTFRLHDDNLVITAEPPSELNFESAKWITTQRRSIRVKLRHLDGLQTMTFRLP